MKMLKNALAISLAAGLMTGLPMTAVAQSGVRFGELQSLPKNTPDHSLIIHKYSNNTPGEAGNGTEIDTRNLGDALKGAKFKIEKVKKDSIDLTTNEGWKKAEKVSKGAEPLRDSDFETLPDKDEQTTGEDGVARWDGLPLGLYRVTETEAPVGHQISQEPFYVALPTTDPTNHDEWLKTVHVYPKNTKRDETTKTVQDEAVRLAGDTTTGQSEELTYKITSQLSAGKDYTKYVVSDFYPTDRLEYAGDNLLTVELANAQLDGSKYEVTTGTVDNKSYLVITFTKGGLNDLNNNKTAQLVITPTFTVKQNTDLDNVAPIINEFKVIQMRDGQPEPPNPEDPKVPPVTPPGTPTPDPKYPKSFYGNVDIVKKNADGQSLGGAEFSLYVCTKDGVIDGQAKPLREEIRATDDVEIKGLLANDYRNGQAVAENDRDAYCLVETKAPVGYELSAQPIRFQILTNQGADAEVALVSQDVVDTKKNGGFNLPLTGGAGVMYLLLAGGAFLLVGRGYSAYSNRRNA
ncbi:SpaH/EbpB family LPXTG-anchored major pilin [Corynebacterium sp. ES2715-CONJ3]|uniref:SpaH/EbpB family LPXTG-anchored major pilin n=1 Tax=Corynebacterium sp. ES2715-CONJ3 TaxID=2974028 RepID=UPI00216997D3|nr:SpaH/EbpB family LPXTG-anchored major pilin [Corynebacterium sp. ES2715-CONJ3]MCS4491309.1 SpaH/EbpB family LPXTG-anchored major pilin [Corynebacterium sp. ES2715-CONJ3]